MKDRQILWAMVFGSMLAVTGCGVSSGDDGGSGGSGSGGSGSGGMSGTGGSGGGGSTDICDTFCGNCGDATASCKVQCAGIVGDPGDANLEVCTDEIDAVGTCIEDNGCESLIFNCIEEFGAWSQCLVDTIL